MLFYYYIGEHCSWRYTPPAFGLFPQFRISQKKNIFIKTVRRTNRPYTERKLAKHIIFFAEMKFGTDSLFGMNGKKKKEKIRKTRHLFAIQIGIIVNIYIFFFCLFRYVLLNVRARRRVSRRVAWFSTSFGLDDRKKKLLGDLNGYACRTFCFYSMTVLLCRWRGRRHVGGRAVEQSVRREDLRGRAQLPDLPVEPQEILFGAVPSGGQVEGQSKRRRSHTVRHQELRAGRRRKPR